MVVQLTGEAPASCYQARFGSVDKPSDKMHQFFAAPPRAPLGCGPRQSRPGGSTAFWRSSGFDSTSEGTHRLVDGISREDTRKPWWMWLLPSQEREFRLKTTSLGDLCEAPLPRFRQKKLGFPAAKSKKARKHGAFGDLRPEDFALSWG